MKQIYLRADGSSKIGLGHVMRLLAISDMLKDSYHLTFVIRDTETEIIQLVKSKIQQVQLLTENDSAFLNILDRDSLVFLDGYSFESSYQKLIKETGASLICIDDLFDRHFYADAVVNHAGKGKESFYSKEPYTKLFLGPDYALLREPFLKTAKQKRKIERIDTIFINMGGSDEHNITEKTLFFSEGINWIQNINIVVGATYKHLDNLKGFLLKGKKINIYQNIDANTMCEILEKSQLAICPASTISFEVCAVGLFCITGYTAENQKHILEDLVNCNVAESIGSFFNLDVYKFKQTMETIHQTYSYSEMINFQKKYVDGESGNRIFAIVNFLIK
jgi:UDP-2,4-diacetamido-2,4,6-trideoxy-beta-L-altropyranose hydrolase